MIYKEINEFNNAAINSNSWCLLSLDFGSKKIGTAYVSSMVNVVMPLQLIYYKKPGSAVEQILTITKDRQITGIVIGWPLEMSGHEGIQTELVTKFADKLMQKIKLPIYLQDERMSTAMANRLLMPTLMSRKQRSQLDDQLAAAVILESFLIYAGVMADAKSNGT
jgi:putative Holliday junction resolvase